MILSYLKNISANITACIINPSPIVITFNISRCTVAFTNNRASPAQTRSTKSILGNVSVNPLIIASILGMVAECNTITAIHPNVSAEIIEILTTIKLVN